MKFYDILQLDPQKIKSQMKDSDSQREKVILGFGMALRSILIVLFAIIFISALSGAFGSKNSPMAVVIFCILLAVRFVDFGYCVKDELVNLSIVFFILLICPVIACACHPLLGFLLNVASIFTILLITCDKPEMGNGGLFGFAYIYLMGNPVYGEILLQRSYLTGVGLVICGLVFYGKHKDKYTEIRFGAILKQVKLADCKYQWMIRMTVGISIILLLGMALPIERFMWAGFACSSILSLYSPSPNIKSRFLDRLIGALAGALVFYVVYSLLPSSLYSLIGPLGGLVLGFCVDYKYKTAMNSMGALMIASQIYGEQQAILLRITDTVIGLVFAFVFFYFYEQCVSKRLRNQFV